MTKSVDDLTATIESGRVPSVDGERVDPETWHIPSVRELDAVRAHYEVPVAAWTAALDCSVSMWYRSRRGERDLGAGTLRRAVDVAQALAREGRLPEGCEDV